MTNSAFRITKVVARHLKMHLPHPYVMSSGVMYHADTVLVEVYCAAGDNNQEVVGYGEGAPYHSPTAHELAPDILKFIQTTAAPKMLNKDPIHLLMEEKFTTDPDPDHIVALGAIDIALWDLRGKLENKPVCDLLGRVRDTADVLWPVSSDNSLQDDIKAFEEKVANGFHSFMVKCGSHNVQTDIDRVTGLLKHKFDKPVEIIPDANQGWNLEQATEFVKAMPSEPKLAFLEQPLHRDQPPQEMLKLHKVAGDKMIFSADESIRTVEDLDAICQHKHFHVGSIKVCKVGGITGARKACTILAKGGIQLYFNSMIEGSCAQAALLHVYCSTEHGVMTHLGHAFMSVLRLEEYADFVKCLSPDRSTITVALDRPGLGLTMNPQKVEEQTSDKIEVSV